MAVRSLPARLCRHCSRPDAQLSSRRFASTSSGTPADEPVLQEQQNVEEVSSPIASTSRAGAEEANILSSLQFEINQATPAPGVVWTRLRRLHETSPTSLAERERLVQSTIPILSRYSTPGKSVKGLAKIIAVQEEAEALYARYRFISNRLKDAGALERKSAQENDELLYVWLKSISALGYGPAAWRIWEDYMKTAKMDELTRMAKPIAHAVLIATMKWVVLQRDRDVQTRAFKSQAMTVSKELPSFTCSLLTRANVFLFITLKCLQQANQVIEFLKDANLYDWIARSLVVRILKESEEKKALIERIKDELDFDPNFPSLIPTQSDSYMTSLPSAKRMDPHTLNTMLKHFAAEGDISKMISLFETAIGSTPSRAKSHASEQVPFFSSSADFASSQAASTSTQTESPPIPTGSVADEAAAAHSKSLDLACVNTHTFELLIREAIQADRLHLAHHYLKLSVTAWKQERLRLLSALQPLASWTRAESEDRQAIIASITQIAASRVSISTRAFYPIYLRLKHSKDGKMRYTPILTSCLRLAKECLDLLQHDTLYLAKAHDQFNNFKAALTPREKVQLSQKTHVKGFGRFDKPFHLKTHVLLQSRLQVELGELVRYIEVASMDTVASRQLEAVLYKLSVSRPTPPAAAKDEILAHTILIDRLRNGIIKAERWLAQDMREEKRRLALMRQTLGLTATQMEAKIREKKRKYAGKREILLDAITQAEITMKKAITARREAMEAAEAEPRAHSKGVAADLQEVEAPPTALERENLHLLDASSGAHHTETIHEPSQAGPPQLALC